LGITMTIQQIPNVRVWLQGRDYVESAEILLDYNRVQPAAVVAGLAIEIFIKSFLATRHATGHARTERGHSGTAMFQKLPATLQDELLVCFSEVDTAVDFVAELTKHDGAFVLGRYWYEPTASKVLSSDTVYFARHLCETVFLLGQKRSA